MLPRERLIVRHTIYGTCIRLRIPVGIVLGILAVQDCVIPVTVESAAAVVALPVWTHRVCSLSCCHRFGRAATRLLIPAPCYGRKFNFRTDHWSQSGPVVSCVFHRLFLAGCLTGAFGRDGRAGSVGHLPYFAKYALLSSSRRHLPMMRHLSGSPQRPQECRTRRGWTTPAIFSVVGVVADFMILIPFRH